MKINQQKAHYKNSSNVQYTSVLPVEPTSCTTITGKCLTYHVRCLPGEPIAQYQGL